MEVPSADLFTRRLARELDAIGILEVHSGLVAGRPCPVPVSNPIHLLNDTLVDGQGNLSIPASRSEAPDPASRLVELLLGHVLPVEPVDPDEEGLVADAYGPRLPRGDQRPGGDPAHDPP